MKNLRSVRRESNVRAEDLAEATGIDLRRIWRIERGDHPATVEEAVAIARFLGVTVENLASEPASSPAA